MDVIALLTEYRYIFLFAGMFALGEVVLIPALYLSYQGVFDPLSVFVISFSATLIADAMWYAIGRRISRTGIEYSSFIRERRLPFDKLMQLFDAHGLKILYGSKFIYGTRTITQIIAGFRRINVRDYVITNTLGALTYLMLFFLLGGVMSSSFDRFGLFVNQAKLVFAFMVLIFIGIHLWVQQLVKRKWFQ